MLFLLLACDGETATPKDDSASAGDSSPADDTGDLPLDLPDPEVVHLETADGLTLEGDWYAQAGGAPSVLLLHMTPVAYDRTTWSVDWIEALRADGFAVLAIDRRGAGGSEGEPQDAYDGPEGVNDARGGVDFLLDHGATDIRLVGASNGTTTALDYTVTASAAGYPAPERMVFMSGGSYTETNHDMEELVIDLLLFTYPRGEANWNEAQAELDPGTWTFEQYAGNAHGTEVFEDSPDTAEFVRAWLSG